MTKVPCEKSFGGRSSTVVADRLGGFTPIRPPNLALLLCPCKIKFQHGVILLDTCQITHDDRAPTVIGDGPAGEDNNVRESMIRSSAAIIAFLALISWAQTQRAHASDEDLRIDLGRDVGLPNDILQWKDSWWIGGENGAFRVTFDPPIVGKRIAAVFTNDRLATSDAKALSVFNEALYVGSKKGLFRWDPRATNPIPGGINQLSSGYAVIALRPFGGYLWVAYQSLPPVRLATGLARPTKVVGMDALVEGFGEIYENIWMCSVEGVYEWDKTQGGRPPSKRSRQQAHCILPRPDRILYGGANPDGVYSLPVTGGGTAELVLGNTGRVNRFLVTREGGGETTWVATDKDLYSWKAGQHRPGPLGLNVGKVTNLYAPPGGGTLLIVAEKGLYRLDGLDGTRWDAGITFPKSSPTNIYVGEPLHLQWNVTNYAWRTTPKLVRWRVRLTNTATKGEQTFPKDGWFKGRDPSAAPGDKFPFKLTIPPRGNDSDLLTEGSFALTVEAYDLHGIRATQDYPGNLAVDQRPPIWWRFLYAFVLLSAGLVYMLVDPGRARILFESFKAVEYKLTSDECEIMLAVEPSDAGRFRVVQKRGGASSIISEVTVRLDADSGSLERVPPGSRGFKFGKENILLEVPSEVEIDRKAVEVPFSLPWAFAAVDGGLKDGDEATIVGQMLRGNEPEELKRTGALAAAVLGAGNLFNKVHTLDQFVETLKDEKVEIVRRSNEASVVDLRDALREADVVIVVAHALREKGIALSGDQYFGPDQLAEAAETVLQCRLLILATCWVGAGGGDESLLRGFQRRGVNVVGSVDESDTFIIAEFMRETLKSFLRFDVKTFQGKTLADALRSGANACLDPNKNSREFVRSTLQKELGFFILYGNPMLLVKPYPGKLFGRSVRPIVRFVEAARTKLAGRGSDLGFSGLTDTLQ